MFRNNHQTRSLLLVVCAAPSIALAQGSASTQEPVTTTREQRADGAFAAWSKGGTPGCALGVGPYLVTQATGQPMFTVFPASERSFFPKEFEVLLTFDPPGKDKKSPGVTITQGGRDLRATRIERVRPTAQQLQAYSGTYFSDELNTLYFVSVRGEGLYLRYPRGALGLQPLLKDEFGTMYPVNAVKFTCTAADMCEGLSVTTDRVGNPRFRKVSL